MAEFVTLTCPTCGAKLNIDNYTATAQCAYCGNAHKVNRQNGSVSLDGAFQDMRSSMDKTTAELAIARLSSEISRLEQEIATVEATELLQWAPRKESPWVIMGVIVGMIGFFVTMSLGYFWPCVMSLLIFGTSLWAYSKRSFNTDLAQTNKQNAIVSLQEALHSKREALAQNQSLVS